MIILFYLFSSSSMCIPNNGTVWRLIVEDPVDQLTIVFLTLLVYLYKCWVCATDNLHALMEYPLHLPKVQFTVVLLQKFINAQIFFESVFEPEMAFAASKLYAVLL